MMLAAIAANEQNPIATATKHPTGGFTVETGVKKALAGSTRQLDARGWTADD
jgi:hypothetical protein